MAHYCPNLVVACIDYRFHGSLRQWADGRFGPAGYDLTHVAGGAGAILNPRGSDFMIWQIELAIEKHQVEHLVLINHLDCGAYGGRAAFTDDQAERQKHLTDLNQVRELILNRQPQLKITLLLHQVDGSLVPAI